MKGFYRNRWRRFWYWAIGLALGSGLLVSTSAAIAQRSLRLRLPDISAPGNRESGATRSTSCIAPREKVIALMPQTNFGLTQSGYPTFYFYLPPTEATQVKFVVLNDATNEIIYDGRFSLKADISGIVSVSLPNSPLQQPLEIDQTYVWYLAVVCDVNDPSADIVTEGYVQRVEPPAGSAAATPATLPAVYAEAGLWYDALAASAALRASDSAIAWNLLLEAVALNELIPLPLLTHEPSTTEQIPDPNHP